MTKEVSRRSNQTKKTKIALELAYVPFVLRRFIKDGLMQSVGALTYSSLLALVPLLVIAFAIFSAFPAFEAEQQRLQAIVFDNIVPETSKDLRAYLNEFTSNARELTAVGVVALVTTAVILLFTIESTLNKVWHVDHTRPFFTRLLVFWALLTLGPMLIATSIIVSSDFLLSLRSLGGETTAVARAPDWMRNSFAILVQSTLFTFVFLFVPATPVRLSDALLGGVAGGIGFELLKWAFAASIASGATYTTIYGAVSAVPIFLLWIYGFWTVIILGAVFSAARPEWRYKHAAASTEASGPTQILMAAVSALRLVVHQNSAGGSVRYASVADVIPLRFRDELIAKLLGQSYLVETKDQRLSLSRDLHQTTLADLARDLDLTLGTSISPETADGPLETILMRLRQIQDDTMGISLAEIAIDAHREVNTSEK